MNIQYYSVNDPKIDELVLVHFIEKCDAFFNAKLIEYKYDAIMNFQDATKKKKILSWTKYVELNKDMVAKVDSIDKDKKLVQISLVYLEDIYNKKLTPKQIQLKLLSYFIENKYMEKFVNSLCIFNNLDYTTVWKLLVYEIDIKRRIYNDENNLNLSLWNYFNENIFNLEINNEIKDKVLSLYNKKNYILSHKIQSRIGIISADGINILINILNDLFKDININFIFKYDTTPFYILESTSDNSTSEDHKLILDKLEDIIKKNNLNIYLKKDFIGKE
jgi:translation initiation factor 2 alpha subunit (eIF-2alpha)